MRVSTLAVVMVSHETKSVQELMFNFISLSWEENSCASYHF